MQWDPQSKAFGALSEGTVERATQLTLIRGQGGDKTKRLETSELSRRVIIYPTLAFR